MHTTSQTHIAAGPEVAVLKILDVAAEMSIALLMLFYPLSEHHDSHRDPAHYLANSIIADASQLRRSLSIYLQDLNVQRDRERNDMPF